MGGLGEIYERKMMKDISTKIPPIINLAEKYNLPVEYLRYVVANYGRFYTLEKSEGTSYTDTIFDEIHLEPGLVESLNNLDPSDFMPESDSLQTLYHEMTHAYIDLRENEWATKELIASAETYYEGAKLQNGEEVGRTYQVVQEAAGAYVGHRVATYWNALQGLHWLRNNYSKGIDPLKYGKNSNGSLAEIEKTYNAEMSRIVYGYEQGLFSGQIPVKKPIFHRLKYFCDTVILENKIKAEFSELLKGGTIYTNKFKSLVDEINTQKSIWFDDHSVSPKIWA